MAPKTSNGADLRDGHWYSIIIRHPRRHQHAKWVCDTEHFIWSGTSETKEIHLDEVAEILNEVDPEFLEPGVTYGC